MTDECEYFTKLTWRKGKRRVRRPRKNCYAGRTKAPAAFLEAAKAYQFGKGVIPSCLHCGLPAMTGMAVCRRHGGAAAAAKRGEWIRRETMAQRFERIDQWHAQQKAISQQELVKLPIYQNASEAERKRLQQVWKTPQWIGIVCQL